MAGASAPSLVGIFATAITPIVAIAAVGYLLGRTRGVDPDPLNTITVYVLAPALVFHSLATSPLAGGTLLWLSVGVVAFTAVVVLVAGGVGVLSGDTEPLFGAFVLVSAFPNAGNYGIPLSDFAFGPTGRSTAVVFIVAQGVLLYTVGVYIAARGSGGGVADGLKQVFSIPLVYAVAAALLARWLGVLPPVESTALTTVGMVGNAAIPVMLLLLGIQLSGTRFGAALGSVARANVLKMAMAPLVAMGIALAIPFPDAVVARVFVLECAMPTAVTPLILVGEFSEGDIEGVAPESYVSTVVFTSTLLSIPVLTVLIGVLKSGVVI